MLSAEVKGQQQVINLLVGTQKELDTVKILDEAGAFLFNRIRDRFLRQVDPDGRPWEESQAAKRRREKGKGGGTLYDTGTLFRSIQLHKVGDDSRAISTDVPYAPKHNFGRGQVKRMFLGFGTEDVDLTRRLILKRFSEAIRA